jgi:hypothetical protein
MPKKRGQNAAKSGAYGEDVFQGLLEAANFPVIPWNKYDKETTPVAVSQYPVPHPFRPDTNRTGRNDFFLFTGAQKVYCQVKNQNGGGTTDEKIAFTFDIARYALSDRPFDLYLLILLGMWWPQKPGIIKYAKRKCREFEMLADGIRLPVKAQVLVGPKEAGVWVREMPVVAKHGGLFSTDA